jgi:peptidoglycan/LPS O-acetylase OafA/YrhL
MAAHAAHTASAPVTVTSSGSENRFFTDIEGLRGVAVTAVVAYHAGIPFVSGGFVGVDVFFVISGFLITGQLLREYERRGRISLKGFYARRFRRIIPPAALVIVATSAAIWLLLPLLSIFRQAFDLLAASVEVANWRFIAQGKDYLAGGSDDSVATHFWSLSVEEQFYLVWPLLVILAALLARRRGWSVRSVAAVVIALSSAASFVASLHFTATDPVLSYMASQTRAWQFGVGALVAICGPPLSGLITRVSARIAMCIVGWAGAVAVLVACVGFDHTVAYPGWAATVPTLGAGAIIFAGQIAGNATPAVGAALSVGWLRWLGKVSYSWYLWHWPAVVLFKERTHVTAWPVLAGVMVVALVAAWLSTALLERPLMSSPELKRNLMASLSVGMTAAVIAVAATMSIGVLSVKKASASVSNPNVVVSFEKVFGSNAGATSGPVTPNPFQAYEDRPLRDDCLVEQTENRTPDTCVYGPPDGVPAVLFGDSHAEQWLPLAQTVAQDNNWRLYQFTKAACPAPALQPRDGRTDPFVRPNCLNWRADALKRIADIKPKYIIVTSLSIYVPEYQELKVAWDQTLAQLRATGARLLYIRDTPYPNRHVPECISGALDNWSKCDFDLDNMNRIEPIVTDQLRGENLDIPIFDFTSYLCDGTRCHSVRNGILIYRDNSHLTATAARVLTEAFRQTVQAKGINLSGQ